MYLCVLLSVWIKIRKWLKHSLYMLTLKVFRTVWTLILRVSMFRLTSDDKVYKSLGLNPCNVYFTFCVWIRVVGTFLHQRGEEREGTCVDTAKSFRAEYQSLRTFTNFRNSQQTTDVGVTDGRNGVTVTSLYDWPSGHKVHCSYMIYSSVQ